MPAGTRTVVMEQSNEGDRGWASLPVDLVVEISFRLPFDALPAFKLTCRQWNAAVQEGQQSLSPRLLDDRLASTVPNLRTLDLTTCKDADAPRLMSLRPLRGLRHLAVRLPEHGLQPLAMEIGALMQLTSLDLSGSRNLADDQLVTISQQRRLRRLNLTDCIAITDVGILVMASLLPHLEALTFALVEHLETSTKVSDESCMALAALPLLEDLDLRNHQGIGPRGIEVLAAGRAGSSLRRLRIANCPALCEEGVEAVSRLPNLEELELGYLGPLSEFTQALPAGSLAPLSRLKSLRQLTATGCQWEAANAGHDERVMALRNLTNLEELDVSSPGRRRMRDTCQRLDCFPVPSLTSLDISRTAMPASALAPLATARRLRHLDCHECMQITCQALNVLGGLPDIRSLCLDDCEGLLPSGPNDMAFLGKLTRLESLTWTNRNGAPTWIASDAELHDDCSRAASVLTHIPSMPRLRRLHLCRQSLDPLDRTLGMLSQATALEDLDLGGCFSDCPGAFNEALTALAPLSRLSRLGLEATPVDGSGLHGFCSSITGLRELNLSRTNLSDEDAEELTVLRALRVLKLDEQKSCAIGDAGLRTLACLPNLGRLSMMGNCDVSASGLARLSRAPRLSSLDLSGSVDIDIATALRSLQGCQQLGEVVLGDPAGVARMGLCVAPKAVRKADIAYFRSRLPLLRRLVLGSQVQLMDTRTSYVLAAFQVNLQMVLLDAVQACVAINMFCRRTLTRLRSASPLNAILQ